MAPPPLLPILLPACFSPRNVPTRLTSSVRRSSSIDVFTIGVNGPSTPALLTSTCRPSRSPTAASQLASSATSRCTYRALPPISFAVTAPSSSRTSATITVAPSAANRRASSAPWPRAAPVTRTVLPSNRAAPYGFSAADDPHGEELRAAAVGVADGEAGAVDLVLTGLAAHLHGRLAEADHPRGADRVRRQHAAGHVHRQVARVDLRDAVLDHPPPLAGLGEQEVLQPHRLEPRERHVHLDAVDLTCAGR